MYCWIMDGNKTWLWRRKIELVYFREVNVDFFFFLHGSNMKYDVRAASSSGVPNKLVACRTNSESSASKSLNLRPKAHSPMTASDISLNSLK